MALSKKMLDALNAQINAELHSAYLYLEMANWCEVNSFKGFASWLRVQFQEEQMHAFKLLDYTLERGQKPSLGSIEAPHVQFETIAGCFKAVLEHERHVTSLIHKLYHVAVEEKDIAAQIFLQWFVTEQVEEEANAEEILAKLQMVGDKPGSALYLDKEYGKRKAE